MNEVYLLPPLPTSKSLQSHPLSSLWHLVAGSLYWTFSKVAQYRLPTSQVASPLVLSSSSPGLISLPFLSPLLRGFMHVNNYLFPNSHPALSSLHILPLFLILFWNFQAFIGLSTYVFPWSPGPKPRKCLPTFRVSLPMSINLSWPGQRPATSVILDLVLVIPEERYFLTFLSSKRF